MGIRRISEQLTVGVLDLKSFAAMTGDDEKRAAEKKGARFLLGQMLNDPALVISYDENNRPHIAGRKEHVSISHSHDRLAVAVNSTEETGIDIELIRDKVLRIAHKFIGENERVHTGNDTEKLITWWAAKESLYKAGGERGIDFRTHMEVVPAGDGLLKGRISLKRGVKHYLLHYRKHSPDYILVFTINEV